MSVLRPLARVGTALWEFLGLSKNTAQGFTGINSEITPTINVSPFLVPELIQEYSGLTGGVTLGAANIYSNTSGSTQILYGISAFTGTLGAGVTCEARPILIGPNTTNPVPVGLGSQDYAGVGEQVFCGGQFFESPVPIPPGWSIGLFISTLTGAGPTFRFGLLYTQL
jgi:hypothetical protein